MRVTRAHWFLLFSSPAILVLGFEARSCPFSGIQSTSTVLEMALLRRQSATFEVFDDQSPTLWNSYVGNWTRYNTDQFNNDTITATPTPGASLSFTFSGSQAWLYGGLLNLTDTNGTIVSYPTADYQIDGVSVDSQKPWFDNNGSIVYFQTPKLADGTHKIDITVTAANDTDLFILDYFLITPVVGGGSSGVETSRSIPFSTTTPSSSPTVATYPTSVGAIIGSVLGGGAGIVILVILVWYLLRSGRYGQLYYYNPSSAKGGLIGEAVLDRPESSNVTTTTATPSSSLLLKPGKPGPGNIGTAHVSGNTAQQKTEKTALVVQNKQQPVQHDDSGIGFDEKGEQSTSPSQSPDEVPSSCVHK